MTFSLGEPKKRGKIYIGIISSQAQMHNVRIMDEDEDSSYALRFIPGPTSSVTLQVEPPANVPNTGVSVNVIQRVSPKEARLWEVQASKFLWLLFPCCLYSETLFVYMCFSTNCS